MTSLSVADIGVQSWGDNTITMESDCKIKSMEFFLYHPLA